MSQVFFDWSGWIFGFIGAVGTLMMIFGMIFGRRSDQRVTTNTVEGGNRNSLSGGPGQTTNSVKRGDDNVLKG